jgi:hypothetical protein
MSWDSLQGDNESMKSNRREDAPRLDADERDPERNTSRAGGFPGDDPRFGAGRETRWIKSMSADVRYGNLRKPTIIWQAKNDNLEKFCR